MIVTTVTWSYDSCRDMECYELKLLGLNNRTTLVLSNTRKLNRDPFYKLVYLLYYYQWPVLTTVHPTLNDHV